MNMSKRKLSYTCKSDDSGECEFKVNTGIYNVFMYKYTKAQI